MLNMLNVTKSQSHNVTVDCLFLILVDSFLLIS